MIRAFDIFTIVVGLSGLAGLLLARKSCMERMTTSQRRILAVVLLAGSIYAPSLAVMSVPVWQMMAPLLFVAFLLHCVLLFFAIRVAVWGRFPGRQFGLIGSYWLLTVFVALSNPYFKTGNYIAEHIDSFFEAASFRLILPVSEPDGLFATPKVFVRLGASNSFALGIPLTLLILLVPYRYAEQQYGRKSIPQEASTPHQNIPVEQ